MGCGSNNAGEIKIRSLDENVLQDIGISLKESLFLYFSKNNSLNINIGLYTDIIYTKKKGSEKIFKIKNEKFFLKNNKKKVINNNILKKYYALYPKFIKNSSVDTDDKFSQNFLLNNNFDKIFETLGIKLDKNKDNKFAICFLNNNIKNDILTDMNNIKNRYENNFFIYLNKNVNDEAYIPYENYILFFKGNDVDFWIENKLLNIDNFNLFMNHEEYSFNKNIEIIQNYIKQNQEREKEYIIKYKYYEIYDKNGDMISSKNFPLIILSQKNDNMMINKRESIIQIYQEKKPKFDEYIINEIKTNFKDENIKIEKIEIFKERITSFLNETYFISKKKYSIYLPPIESKILYPLIQLIKNKINQNDKYIYDNNLIENLIILPKINTKFNFYQNDKFIYIIMFDSTCFNFAKTLLKKKYKDIYGNKFIQFICVYKNKNINLESDTNIHNEESKLIKMNEEILSISEDILANKENNLYEFYIHSFNDINYFSHILLITNEEGIITYVNYFNNRAQIFDQYLKEKGMNIKKGIELINTENFKKVKKFYIEKSQLLLNNIENINNENTIEFTDESVFSNFYIKDIFHQPYLSLKYNKIIKPDEPDNEKFYKNYSLNYMNIENIMELNFDSNEHQCLNEISHIYHEKEVYIEFKKDLRCKNCFKKINKNEGISKDKYIFYICPISKDIICQKCYRDINNKYEETYPYNLLYIKCKDQLIFNFLPKDNILLFKERVDCINHLEIFNEKCDLCNKDLCISENKKMPFYILVRILRKNYFLICHKCFEILISDEKELIFDEKYNYINTFVINYFIDLNNLIFKIIRFK